MKHITSKLLSLLLCLAMLMSMVPVAYAVEGTEGTGGEKASTETNGGASEQDDAYDDAPDTAVVQSTAAATTYAAKVGEVGYATLAEAITAAEDDATVTLLADRTEDVTITKSITLDLGGKTLTNTNAGKATISVTGGAVTVKNGTVTGAASYYNIEVTKGSNANLTLENVTATAGNTGSSMIDNWGTLTINSGDYSGGLNVVKSEEGSTLTINGGKFTLSYATDGYTGVIFAYGDTTISGGEFIQNLTTTGRWNHPQVILAGVAEGYTSRVKVTGGSFTNKMSRESIFRGVGKANSDNFEVSGGTFNKSISDGYCADGFIPTKNADGTYGVKEGKYVAQIGDKKYETLADAIRLAAKGKTVTLLNDVDLPGNVVINKSITLDLNGKKIYNTTDIWHDADENDENDKNIVAMFDIKNGADVIITGNGTVEAKQNDCYNFNIVKGSLTIENGTFIGNVSAVQVQNGHLAIKGGKFDLLQKWKGKSTFLINCIDDAWADGSATVAISGGTFVNFDPAHGPEEGNPSFCAPGYKTELTNGVYVVKAGTNDAISAIDAALAAIKADQDAGKTEYTEDTQKKIDAALDAIVDIPNENLSDTTTLGKLAELDSAVKKDTSSVEVKTTGSIKDAQNAALSADPDAEGKQTITINAAGATLETEQAKNVISAAGAEEGATVKALTITMSRNEEPNIQPNAPVVLTFELPDSWANAQIVDIADDGTVTKVPTTVNTTEKTITGVFNHFSTKAIVQLAATANDNQYEFILEPSVTDVSAGDEITYTVKLKHISGDSRNVGGFIFAPTIENADLLELVESKCVAIGEDVKTSTNTGHFEFTYNKSAGVSVPVGATMDVGTLVYKVKAYGTDNASVAVVGNSSADQVTSVKLNGSAIPSVSTTKSVTYHVTKVTFQQDEKTSSEFFVPYNGSKLYLNLEDLAAGQNEQIAPTLSKDTTGGTAYRVLDEDWHLSTNTAELYNASTKFKTSVTYVPLTVNLVEIVLPSNPTVTVNATEGHPLTERDNRTFVDEGADLNFTVGKNDTNGEKYDVTVKVDDTKVDATLSTNDDGTITGKVDGDAITGKVTFEIKSVLDLTEDDIGIFTKGEDDTLAYREYSSYSGDDTLVLIKGKTGANYTLDAGEPTIYANTAYGDGYTHAVLVPKQNTVSKKAMLDYLVAQGLKTTSKANKAINSTSWDTNGNGNENRDLGDYQATNDFKTYGPSEDWGWKPTDDLLMLADVVTLSTNGDKYNADNYGVARDGWVSDTDVNAFVYLYAHLG